MDRQIVYPGSIPLDTDILSIQRNMMIGLGYLAQATLGQTTVADGLACTPTQPPSLAVSLSPGSITQFTSVDSLPFGSLGALPTAPLVKLGINLIATSFTLTAPTGASQAISYLIQASLLESDATPVVLPYYNAANPGQPFSGPPPPAAPGSSQLTQRLQTVQLQVKAGPAVGSGTASIPAVDAGWVGLYVVTVATNQTSIVGSNITTLPTAPFLSWKLPQLSPGTHNLAVFQPSTQGAWSVPPGVSVIKLRLWGGGGAGGNGFGSAGGGGAGGGYTEGFYSVLAGQNFYVTVGNGGSSGGSVGGNSSFGMVVSCTGGQPGASGTAATGGSGATSVGSGYGTGFSRNGGLGGDAFAGANGWLSGPGGGSYASAGGLGAVGASSSSVNGRAGNGPGAGGSGGVGGGIGGQGGAGLVLVEW